LLAQELALMLALVLAEMLVELVGMVLVLALVVDEGKVCWHIHNVDALPMAYNFHQPSRNSHFCFHDKWKDYPS